MHQARRSKVVEVGIEVLLGAWLTIQDNGRNLTKLLLGSIPATDFLSTWSVFFFDNNFHSSVQILYFLVVLQFFIAGYSIATGNVIRLIYGYDSYGNICGMTNSKIENVTQSGMDMTDRT